MPTTVTIHIAPVVAIGLMVVVFSFSVWPIRKVIRLGNKS